MTTASEVLRQAEALPTFPVVVARLSSLMRNEQAGSAEYEKVIRPDPALTANLLRLANSPFFGLRRKVTSVKQAITLMGIKRIFELATSASFNRILPPKIPGFEIDAADLWKHSVAVAIMSERLAQVTKMNPPEMVFTAGLLHDIGKLAIGALLLDEKTRVESTMQNDEISFVHAEHTVIGTDHTEVGALMAKEWDLPLEVEWAVRWHHSPGSAPDDVNQSLIDLVHLADCLAHSIGYGADVGELSRKMEDGAAERIGVRVQDLELTASDTVQQIQEMGESPSQN